MSEDHKVIRAFLSKLVFRDRALLLASMGLRLVVVWAVVASAWVIPSWLRWNRESAVFGVAVVLGLGVWAALVLPLLRGWRATGDAERQARLAEAVEPGLRGRLVAVVGAERGLAPEGAEGLLGLLHARTARVVARVAPGRIHSPFRLWRAITAASVAFVAWIVVWVASPVGPLEAYRWWSASAAVNPDAAAAVDDPAGPRARVGDIILRYVYPDYTGLSPREVPNSTGEAHAPPGTVVYVRARSADPVEAAAIEAYGEPALDAQLTEDGRVVAGQFAVAVEPGTWQVVTYRSGAALRSKSFPIVPELDVAPQVQVDAPETKLEVAVDERITLPWRARDDYGVARVVVEINGREQGVPLAVARERRAELDGRLVGRPRDWGLGPGDRATLVVVAWDNDAVSGSKAGRSRAIQLVVLGASGVDQREDERQRELLDLLLVLLADHLEDQGPIPAAGARTPPTSAALAAWGERVSGWYEKLEAWRSENLGERPARTRRERLERDLVQRVARAGTALIRFTQVAFSPDAVALASAADVGVIRDLHVKAVESVEDAVLALDRMVQLRALREVVDKAKALGDLADEVQRSLAEGMSAQEMLTRLDRLERAVREVMEQAAQMQEGGLREFVNQRGTEMSNLMEEIRKALEKGDMAEAQALMERLARELQQFSEGVEEQLNRKSEQGDEQMKAAQELQKELSQLEKEQRTLQEETKKAREQSDSAGAKKAEQIWERLREKSEAHSTRAERFAEPPSKEQRSFFLQQRVENGAERSAHLHDTIAARDLRAAREALEDARQAWMQAGGVAGRSGPDGGASEIAALDGELREIDALLRQLEQQSESTDPRSAQRAKELQQRQQALEQRLDQAQKKAREVARGMSARPRGLEEGLDGAERSMEQAGRDLGQGKPMPAEGAQGSAAEQIREARESLEQAMRDQQSMQSAGSGGSGSEEKNGGGEGEPNGEQGGGDGEHGEDSSEAEDIEIPNPEEFRTPEEFRRELLEGMEGDVPEEYRELKRLYFEELVHQ